MEPINACDYGAHEDCTCPLTCGCPCHDEDRDTTDEPLEDDYGPPTPDDIDCDRFHRELDRRLD